MEPRSKNVSLPLVVVTAILAVYFIPRAVLAQPDEEPRAITTQLIFDDHALLGMKLFLVAVATLSVLVRRTWKWAPWWSFPAFCWIMWLSTFFMTSWPSVVLLTIASSLALLDSYGLWIGRNDDKLVDPRTKSILIATLITLAVVVLASLIRPHKEKPVIISLLSEPPFYAEKLGDQVLDSTLQSPDSIELNIKDPALSFDSTPVDDPFAAPPMVETTAVSEMAPSIGLALTVREKGSKRALLAAYGGNATTEATVVKGLDWLKKQQRSDGSWSMNGPYSNGAGVENVCSATSMALLALQGHGSTHKEGEFKDVVVKGWNAMLKMQDADGDFVRDAPMQQRMYAQAQATIAICEIYGMTKDPKFKSAAQKAIDFAQKSQSREGGWRYTPGIDSDLSVTSWYVMALQSAIKAGLKVQNSTRDKISSYIDLCSSDSGARYAYQPAKSATVITTSAGLLCRQQLGWKRDDERMRRGVSFIQTQPINYADENVYYWYYATQVMYNMGGKDWDQWNAVMRQKLPKHQVTTGVELGSWPPTSDRWGATAGRLYTTCLSILILETYYRHLPIYKHPIE